MAFEESTTALVPPCKKRSWSTTLHGDSDNRVSTNDASNDTAEGALRRRRMAVDPQMDMQGILEHYHSLALAHYSQTKRRRLASAARATQHTQRIAQLTTLHKMAQDTLHFSTRVMRNEERTWRENEGEEEEVEEELRRAEKEKALAEDFLRRFGVTSGGSTKHPPHAMQQVEGGMKYADPANEGQPRGTRVMIGGIPAKFLDLSHFPSLRKSFRGGPGSHHDLSSPEPRALADGKRASCPIIDCTEEIGIGIPLEVSLHPTPSKQNTKRIYVSDASLAHVNGTYVQEGRHRDAPLFVRAGPPRKFMGKWDCRVVLRRESGGVPAGSAGAAAAGAGGEAAVAAGVWKIGLVPARRIAHPRLIGYYVATEDPAKMASNLDRMEEDDDDVCGDGGCGGVYMEPPAGGWRVCQEGADGKGGSATLGRASGLRVLFE